MTFSIQCELYIYYVCYSQDQLFFAFVLQGLPLFYNPFFSIKYFPCVYAKLLRSQYFLHIGVSVLLLSFNCRVATSLFSHEGRVCYQGEYFSHIGTSVLLLFFK